MTTATASSIFEAGKASLDLARRVTLGLVEDMSEEQLMTKIAPSANPPIWILCHLAYADAGFMAGLTGTQPVVGDETWKGRFGMGSTPSDNRADYPPRAEILAAMEKSRAALLDWLGSLDEQKLLEPLPEDFRPFAPNYASLAGSLAWHEGFHGGQLSFVRRTLGLPYTLGAPPS